MGDEVFYSNKQLFEMFMKNSKGRESVGNSIIKWSGWIISVILFIITLYSTLTGN